jgi:tetratricopeptide (TPR) repeat protein
VEIDWVKHQLDHYSSDGEHALRRLLKSEVGDFFLERSFNLLTSYLSIPTHITLNHRSTEIMTRLAQTLHPHMASRGYWSEISFWWSKVAMIAEQLPDAAIKAQIVKQLAITKNDQGEAKEAQHLYEQLTAWPEFDLLSHYLQADILHQVGVCYLRQGSYKQAKEALTRCLAVSDEYNHLELKAYALNQLGNIFMLQGSFGKARRCYEESLATFEANGESDNLACVAYQSLGRLLVLQRHFAEAISLLEQGLAIRRRRREQGGTANNAIHLATAYLGLDRLHDAESLLNEALQTCRDLNDRRGMALCYLAFGHLEAKRGENNAAIAQWQQALDVLSIVPMPSIELEVLAALLPQLLRAGRIRETLLALVRLLSNFRQQGLGPIAVGRLVILNAHRTMEELLARSKRPQPGSLQSV